MDYLVFIILLLSLVAIFYYRKVYNEEKLERKKVSKELDILNQQQTFFIRKMIHEMNTPLSAIELNVSVLLKEHCCVKNVEMIKSSARMLATIYDDIAFHVGKEKICYPAQWINLEEFVANRMLYFDTMASVKNIFLEMQSDSGFYVHMSKTELQRLVDNTLSNAIKYSTNASAIIEIIISYDEGCLNLVFKDTGLGMNEEEIAQLFETYYRANNNIQGLGLGMNIIKEICDDYKITINVQSVKKQGSTFTYIIPKEIVTKNPNNGKQI